MDKNFLRQKIITQRQELEPAVRQEKNKLILGNFVSVPIVQAAKVIMVYLDFRGEVETSGILQWGWDACKVMTAPVTLKQERKLVPVVIHTFDELRIGAYGIREPIAEDQDFDDRSEWEGMETGISSGKKTAESGLSVESLDLVLVPGVAFDRRGGRLGYGGGYYDRFLPRLRSGTITIGLAYDLQLVEQVPTETHDVPLDLLVTETGVIDCRQQRSGA